MKNQNESSSTNAMSLSAKDRYEQGKTLRNNVPHESHADWSIHPDRTDPVQLIEEQNENRLPWLIPVRRSRMSKSPFAFYRGTARLMAHDLSKTSTSGIITQICGDAHLANFGVYASPERKLVFDLNDFDETLPGPWEWDLKRLAASFMIACRHNGFKKKKARRITELAVCSYRKYMAKLSEMRFTDIWYNYVDAEKNYETIKDSKTKKTFSEIARKAKEKDHMHALDRLAEEYQGAYRIKNEKPLLVPLRDISEEFNQEMILQTVKDSYKSYIENLPNHVGHLLRKYRPVDYAIKVVGVGSVGTLCSIILMEGRDRKDPFFLQIKQATKSVLEEYLNPSKFEFPGERVVEGQRLMQRVSDVFLGWTSDEKQERHYYWRQLKDWKASGDVEDASESEMKKYAVLRGKTLARAHARAGDPVAISGYLGKSEEFDNAITVFAEKYADQTVQDYKMFIERIKADRLEIEEI